MPRPALAIAALFPLALAACHGHDADKAKAPAGPTRTAVALLATAKGQEVGTATATSSGDGVTIDVEGADLPPGSHPIHIHEVGKCDKPDFTSAGGHWNPQGASSDASASNHHAMAGDLPDLVVNAQGNGSLHIKLDPRATFDGLMDADGSAIIIHAASGGGRLACGVFKLPQKSAPAATQSPMIDLPKDPPSGSAS